MLSYNNCKILNRNVTIKSKVGNEHSEINHH